MDIPVAPGLVEPESSVLEAVWKGLVEGALGKLMRFAEKVGSLEISDAAPIYELVFASLWQNT